MFPYYYGFLNSSKIFGQLYKRKFATKTFQKAQNGHTDQPLHRVVRSEICCLKKSKVFKYN